MDLTLTDEQEMISSTAREFLEARCPMSHVQEMADDPLGYSPELWKEMAELGWTGLAFDEEHGGFGAGFIELCLLIEEMGRVLLPGPFVDTVAVCGMAVAVHGSDRQKRSLLEAVAAGELTMAYAGVAGVTAERGGDGFVLSGTTELVPHGGAVDKLLLVARDTDGVGTVFVVDTDDPGYRAEPVDGVHPGRRLHRVVVDDVTIGDEGVLGDVGRGDEVAATLEAFGAAATCAHMVGGAQRVLDMTVDYASGREQFGTPIGSFQAIQHRCADMGVDVLSSRLITFEAIWRLGEGLEASEEVSMAKAWVGEAYRRVTASGHQVHGAIGFTREHDLHHYFRHALASELAFGDPVHHWARIADGLDLPA